LQELEKAEQNEQIEKWRTNMKKGVVEVIKWLKRKKEGVTMPIIQRKGQTMETLQEAIEAIRDHWQEVWAPQKTEDAERKRKEAINLMAEEYERDLVEVEWRDPTEEETLKAMRTAKGSGGVDGWVGEEVKYLPAEVASIFRKMAMRWQEAQEVLEAWRRQDKSTSLSQER
jgi:hypothetical protein